MSFDAYLFISHQDRQPHVEVKHVPEEESTAEVDAVSLEYLEQLLQDVGEETAAVIGDTAFRLGEVELAEVISDVAVICELHQIADPSEPHADELSDDFLIHGGSLI